MTDRSEWEGPVGRKWAAEWQRTDRSLAGLTDRLLARIGEESHRRVLDVGCGAGELTLAVARHNPAAQVVGVDVSEPLLEAARTRIGSRGNVGFVNADAAHWRPADFAPDLIMSRHGVMFFADPVGAFAHLGAIADSDARLVFSCFRSRGENGWAVDLGNLLPGGAPAEPPAGAPGPFAFADADHVLRILSLAGWCKIAFEPVDFAYIAGIGADPVAEAHSYLLAIGPAARAAADLAPADRSAFEQRLHDHLCAIERDGLVAFSAAAWIVTATKG